MAEFAGQAAPAADNKPVGKNGSANPFGNRD
jgi:hypothetical protein